MEFIEKSEILIKTALSYFERGVNSQYDQRCMDRTLFLTPRRRKLLPPEASTSQNTQYLDCSSFVGAVYYEAFGYELPHDLTWHMIDFVEPRLYYHEFTHQDFCVGDIIIVSNDACGNESFSAVYLGDKIVGKTEFGGEYKVLQGEQIDEFIDSLLGRFCFIVLRPSLKIKE